MLHYRTYKINEKAPWVTFIHGTGGSSSIWYKQIKAYKSTYNILLIDLRGHGKSKSIKWKKGDTFADIAEDVVDVLHHLHINSSHFISISLGTIVVQTIAKKISTKSPFNGFRWSSHTFKCPHKVSFTCWTCV